VMIIIIMMMMIMIVEARWWHVYGMMTDLIGLPLLLLLLLLYVDQYNASGVKQAPPGELYQG